MTEIHGSKKRVLSVMDKLKKMSPINRLKRKKDIEQELKNIDLVDNDTTIDNAKKIIVVEDLIVWVDNVTAQTLSLCAKKGLSKSSTFENVCKRNIGFFDFIRHGYVSKYMDSLLSTEISEEFKDLVLPTHLGLNIYIDKGVLTHLTNVDESIINEIDSLVFQLRSSGFTKKNVIASLFAREFFSGDNPLGIDPENVNYIVGIDIGNIKNKFYNLNMSLKNFKEYYESDVFYERNMDVLRRVMMNIPSSLTYKNIMRSVYFVVRMAAHREGLISIDDTDDNVNIKELFEDTNCVLDSDIVNNNIKPYILNMYENIRPFLIRHDKLVEVDSSFEYGLSEHIKKDIVSLVKGKIIKYNVSLDE